MSFVAHGMGLVPGAAAVNADASIRERIMDNLVEWLVALKSTTGAVVRDEGNSTTPTAAVAGSYTGVVSRRYQVACTLAGASGVAEVTVTDETPAAQQALWDAGEVEDDGPAGQVVTSGVAFNVGTLGAQLVITIDTAGLALGDKFYVDAGPYRTNLVNVTEAEDVFGSEGNWARVLLEDEERGLGPLQKETSLMSVPVELHVGRTEDQAGELRRLVTEVKRLLRKDARRNALALDTTFEGNAGLALQQLKAGGLVELRVLVTYRTDREDPRNL